MDAITCPCGGNVFPPVYRIPGYGDERIQCGACGASPVQAVRGAAERLAGLDAAYMAASNARLDVQKTLGLDAAGAEAAIEEAAADALASAAVAYITAALAEMAALSATLVYDHDAGRGAVRGDRDLGAALDHAPDGPIEGRQGWRIVRTSGWPVSAAYTTTLVGPGRLPVASAGPHGVRIHCRAEEIASRAERRAKARANHDTYVRDLVAARAALAADPALRAAVDALYETDPYAEMSRMYGPAVTAAGHTSGWPAVPTDEPGRRAAMALAYVGWGWCPGQEGGILLTPGRVPVGVRGALGLPRA